MKRYLKDLNDEELRKVLEKNEKLSSKIYEDISENDMFCQENEFNELNIKKYVKMYDYYNSFYLKVTDTIGFFENVNTVYFDTKTEDIYKEAKKIYDRYMNTINENIRKKNFDLLEEKVNDLCKSIENQLHEYEERRYSIDDLIEELKECYDLEGFYIDDDFVCYEHIEYEKCYQ